MKDRLNKILEMESLARNEFASRIGVQRSNITHILDGRNKPSYDFLLKTLEAFPALNAEWLMLGTGSMYKTPIVGNLFSDATKKEVSIEDETKENAEPDEIKTVNNDMKGDNVLKNEPQANLTEIYPLKSGKAIERIVILYADKSFEVYNN